jgi:hypothetical protein
MAEDDTSRSRNQRRHRELDGVLSGSGAVLQHLDSCYGRRGTPPGTVVALALDEDCVLLGQGRARDLKAVVSPIQMHGVLDTLIGDLVSDPRGAATDNVLLVRVRSGPPSPTESDLAWWSALVAACRTRALLPGELICRTRLRWHALQAHTSGSLARAAADG